MILTQKIKDILKKEAELRNKSDEISETKPDPLLAAKNAPNDKMALFCALFSYGNAKQIYKFLNKIDLNILDFSEKEIKEYVFENNLYYRFQKAEDIIEFLIFLKKIDSIEDIFYTFYKKNSSVFEGIVNSIKFFDKNIKSYSNGLKFLIGTPKDKIETAGPYKRWNLFLRWMVRKDALDLGWWNSVDKKDLIIPLDTHVFKTALKLKWITANKATFKSAEDITDILKELDPLDPVKYDMAIYRLGQEHSEILFNKEEL